MNIVVTNKVARLLTLPLIFVGVVASAEGSLPCKAGVESFKKNVHPLLMQKCTQCHSNGPGPAHSMSDPLVSYQKVKPYINDFNNPSKSVFETKGGNGHCKSYGGAEDCGATQAELDTALQKWWADGENTCALNGAIVTSGKALPAKLPVFGDKDFATLSWDLGEVNPQMKGVIATVDVQQMSVKSVTTPESYRFTKPTVFSSGKPVKVKGLRILLNGGYDSFANGYSFLNLQTNGDMKAPFSISARAQIIIADKGAAIDKVSLAFDELDFTTEVVCKNVVDGFTKNLDSVLNTCSDCHGRKSPNPSGFDLKGNYEQACAQFLLRVNKDFIAQSPLLLYAVGHDGHPVVFKDQATSNEFYDKLKAWLTIEKPVNNY